ncbi:hypothetical protein PHYPSEUDO_015301 [Phytophthora pseudosyringae]|uniref:Uncharacterized protein n=1 Tax=Phytophthora pseudosyringae TaxID=221518 RepID=A0A8T1V664_9STRA|nr:hypothetical protein PHYPSEUDO_015301 [Phytophthora pseudosyringae]
MLATGNRIQSGNFSSGDEGTEFCSAREYPETPPNYFVSPPDGVDDSAGSGTESIRQKLTCDPLNVHPSYRNELGIELAALWPLLCDVFSCRPGCTGEAITESGNVARPDISSSDSDSEENQGDESNAELSESPIEAREKAKAKAKAKILRETKNNKPAARLPADAVNDTLRSGFEAIERVFAARRQPAQSNVDMVRLFGKLTSSIESANAKQQETSEALLQSIATHPWRQRRQRKWRQLCLVHRWLCPWRLQTRSWVALRDAIPS